jgi:glycerophosphoryl diester phosphodiesterase
VSVLGIAHRAGNSLEALRAAVDAGAHVLEADIHAYQGRLEVRHHKSAGPLPWFWDRKSHGPVPLLHDRFHLIHRSVPQLQLHEMMTAARDARAVMLDLKGIGRVGRAVAEHLHQDVPEVPILVCGPWWPSVDAFDDVPWARRVLSARGRTELVRLRRRLAAGRAPYGVSVHRSLLDRRVVGELHDHVELVMTWPVNDEAALEQVLAHGVTGVITDEPRILRAVLAMA